MKQFFKERHLRIVIFVNSIKSFFRGFSLTTNEISLIKYLCKIVDSDGAYKPITYEEQMRHSEFVKIIHDIYGQEVDDSDPEFLVWIASVYTLSLYSMMSPRQKKLFEKGKL